MRLRRLCLSLLLSLCASGAGAQRPPTTENELTVVAPKDPKVVSTYPKDGDAIPGGVTIIKIVFDQAMVADAWSYSPIAGVAFPSCLARPRLLNDRRTFALLCSVALNGSFGLEINASPDFVSAAGRRPPPAPVRFTTTADQTVDLHDALAAAGLTDADDPIMSPDPASGALQVRPTPEALPPP